MVGVVEVAFAYVDLALPLTMKCTIKTNYNFNSNLLLLELPIHHFCAASSFFVSASSPSSMILSITALYSSSSFLLPFWSIYLNIKIKMFYLVIFILFIRKILNFPLPLGFKSTISAAFISTNLLFPFGLQQFLLGFAHHWQFQLTKFIGFSQNNHKFWMVNYL